MLYCTDLAGNMSVLAESDPSEHRPATAAEAVLDKQLEEGRQRPTFANCTRHQAQQAHQGQQPLEAEGVGGGASEEPGAADERPPEASGAGPAAHAGVQGRHDDAAHAAQSNSASGLLRGMQLLAGELLPLLIPAPTRLLPVASP
jgi:hypothetical protein